MSDTLTSAFTAADAGLDCVARSMLASRLHELRADVAADHQAGRAAVRVPGAGDLRGAAQIWAAPAADEFGHRRPDVTSAADAPLSLEEECYLRWLTATGRRLLEQRDRESPPDPDPQVRALLGSSRLGRAVLTQHESRGPGY